MIGLELEPSRIEKEIARAVNFRQSKSLCVGSPSQKAPPPVFQGEMTEMTPVARACVFKGLVLSLVLMSLPGHIASSDSEYPLVKAFLGSGVGSQGPPTIVIGDINRLQFDLDQLDRFLGCLCKKSSKECEIKYFHKLSISSEISQIYNVVNIQEHSHISKQTRIESDRVTYGCGPFVTATIGASTCSVDLSDKDRGPRLDPLDNDRLQNVCAFRCIEMILSSRTTEYVDFGRGPYQGNWFCVNPDDPKATTETDSPIIPDGESTETDRPIIPDGESTETDRPIIPDGESTETDRPIIPDGESTETDRPIIPDGESTETDRPIIPDGESTETDRPIIPDGESTETDRPETQDGESTETDRPETQDGSDPGEDKEHDVGNRSEDSKRGSGKISDRVTDGPSGSGSDDRDGRDGPGHNDDHDETSNANRTVPVRSSAVTETVLSTNFILICLGLSLSLLVNALLCTLWTTRLLRRRRTRSKGKRSPSLIERSEDAVKGVENMTYLEMAAGSVRVPSVQISPEYGRRNTDLDNDNGHTSETENKFYEYDDACHVYQEPINVPLPGSRPLVALSFDNAAFNPLDEEDLVSGTEQDVRSGKLGQNNTGTTGGGTAGKPKGNFASNYVENSKNKENAKIQDAKISRRFPDTCELAGVLANQKKSLSGGEAVPGDHYAVPSPLAENASAGKKNKKRAKSDRSYSRLDSWQSTDGMPGRQQDGGEATETLPADHYSVPPGESPRADNLYSGVFPTTT